MTTVTAAVERITAAAVRAGLNPHCTRPYRGTIELNLDAGQGPDSPFGVVVIGAHSGRVLRASLRHGNQGPAHRFVTGRVCDDMLRALRALPSA